VMHHVHESPKSMTIPLILLAVLSVAGGFMNVPEALAGSSWLADYLSPVFYSKGIAPRPHLSHATEYLLMAVVLGLTAFVIAFAYARFVRKQSVPAKDGELVGAGRLLYHKYYIDEAYDLLFVKPLFLFSTFLDKVIETRAIDRLVNYTGRTVNESSRLFRRIQNGSIGFYIFVMVISIIVLLTISHITI
jgi:NADH-quinone oxidoreductase subunit L